MGLYVITFTQSLVIGYPVDWEPANLEDEKQSALPGTAVNKAFGTAD